MAKSRIIKDLAADECGLDKSLNRLYLIASSLKDTKLVEWTKNELNGYGDNENNLPAYRILKARLVGEYTMIGGGKIWTYSGHDLPTVYFTPEQSQQFRTVKLGSSIVALINCLQNKESICSPIEPTLYPLFEAGTTISISGARKEMSTVQIQNIVQTVKTRVLDSLIFLENKFGCLDNLDIDVDKYEEEDINSIHEKCAQIVYNGCSFNDFTKAKMKNSNVGSGNTLNRQTNVEVNPTVSVNSTKKSLWSRILDKLFKRKNTTE